MSSKNKLRTKYVKPLTERQKLFAAELIKLKSDGSGYATLTLKQAAINAGYTEAFAKNQGCRLYKDPRIRELIEQYREAANSQANIDRTKVLELVLSAVEKAMKGYPITNANGEVIAVRIEPCAAPLLDILCKCTGSYAEEKISHSVSADEGKFGIILNLEGKPKDDKAV